MKKFTFSVLLFAIVFTIKAQAPTWENGIARLIYDKCANCHYTNGPGHVSFMTYQDVFNNAASIGYQTSIGHMPPWPPDRKYRHYQEERFLTANELTKLQTWVDNGAPAGNLANAPAPPIINTADVISSPDLSLRINSFPVFTNSELYQCFVLPTNLTVDKFMTGLEIVPGNSEIVHHVLIFMDTTASHKARTLDANDPNPGYTSFGGVGVSSAVLIGGWVPGTRPQFYTNNFGVRIRKNSDIILQIHYPQGSQNKVDSTKINMQLTTGSLREIFLAPPLNHTMNITPTLDIPAAQTKTFTESFTIPNPFTGFQGISVFTVAPHAHLICKNWLVYAVTAIGGDTIPLIKIDNWDFRWQGFYNFQQPIHLAANDKLQAVALYDNTVNNPFNPSNPPQRVRAGEATTDEMMLVYLAYTLYQNGDENIVLDSTNYALIDSLGALTGIEDGVNNVVSTFQFYSPEPNPAIENTKLNFYSPIAQTITINVVDITGKEVAIPVIKENVKTGFGSYTLNTSNLATGTYIINIKGKDFTKSKELLIIK